MTIRLHRDWKAALREGASQLHTRVHEGTQKLKETMRCWGSNSAEQEMVGMVGNAPAGELWAFWYEVRLTAEDGLAGIAKGPWQEGFDAHHGIPSLVGGSCPFEGTSGKP